jgi:katanin p60 ATPase-containing subunit A1
MKTELLVQLDGLAKSDDLVFLLAASNLPWYSFFFNIINNKIIFILLRELDHAMLRRLEKRVLVDLPSKEARQAMFQQFLPPTVIRESNGLVLFSDLDYIRLSNVCLLIHLFCQTISFFFLHILVH